jgi:hypothetical protein
MLNWVPVVLGHLQESKGLLGVTLVLVYGLGTVFTMIGGEVRASLAERRYRREEKAGQVEYENISYSPDWPEEDSDEFTLTRENYLRPQVPSYPQPPIERPRRNLSEAWRERVREAAQPVMEMDYHDWRQMNQQTSQWPTWSPEELAQPGRHRLDETQVVEAMPVSPAGRTWHCTPETLRALVTPTDAFEKYAPQRELIGVGG